MAERHQELFAVGTGPWALKKFKAHLLAALLADLAALERNGLEDDQCQKIVEALNRGSALLSDIQSGGFFRKAFWEELVELRGLYERWNNDKDPNGNHAELRRRNLVEMIRHRAKMWSRFPRQSRRADAAYVDSQHDLLASIDRDVIDEMHLAFKGAVTAHAKLFPAVGRALAKYEKVISTH